MLLRTLAATLSPSLALAASSSFSLSNLQWTLKNQNGSIVIPGTLPSQAHLDLTKAGVITEPLRGINDYTQRWIFSDNWTYTADVTPFTSIFNDKSQSTLLLFYGIDTVANITLGGQPVAWTDNEFRQYTFNVTDILSSIGNATDKNLTIALESPWLYGLNVSSRPDTENLLIGDLEVPGARQWVRKAQSDFGWDWGPAFVPTGIHKPAYFITLPSSSSENTTIWAEETSIEISKQGQKPSIEPDASADWVVNVTLGLRAASNVTPSMVIYFPELNITSPSLALESVPGGLEDPTWVSATFTVPNGVPELWYTHNLGNPKRYNITVSLSPGDLTFTKATGFRTIVLHQEDYTQDEIEQYGFTPGSKFQFTLNGKPFYTSGSNIIPFDPFYARINTATVRWMIESAVKSGQNMLRIWGGGVYQPSDEETGTYDFYEICDELGILAWSELIFSDALYPINEFLLDTIKPEVQQNVRRVNRHPSNAQWAGGNEIEGIIEVVNTSIANGTHYVDEFVFLFQDFLHDIVLSETNSTAYTDCSTTSGYLTLDPYVLRFTNGTSGYLYGNSERYNYDASVAFDYTTYPSSRYVNEFGFHSLPSFYSWEEVLESPDDFSFNSTVVASRDHHPPAGNLSWPNPNSNQGQAQMTQGVELWLPTPGTTDSNQTFAQWCWSTQVFQSMNMISEIAFYRRGAGRPENNLGALVWQLNDIWQGASWSSIEYSGRWKVLNYGEAQIFAPVIIYPYWTAANESLEVYVTSDRWSAVNGTAQLSWYNWNGTVLNSTTYDFTVPSLNNSLIFNATGLENILPSGSNASDVFMRLNITAQTDSGTVTNEAIFNPTSLANVTLVDPAIKVTAGDKMTFTLSAQGGVGAWTWLDHPAGTVGYFYDTTTNKPVNGFYLIPGQDRTVAFSLNSELSKAVPNAAEFVVRSAWNNTHL